MYCKALPNPALNFSQGRLNALNVWKTEHLAATLSASPEQYFTLNPQVTLPASYLKEYLQLNGSTRT
jgi:hypothetical protein